MRFSVDYRKLNAVSKPNVYPILRMDEFFSSLGRSEVIYPMSGNSGYSHVEIENKEREKTAIVWLYELFCVWMPFGLWNAPPALQRAMAIALSAIKEKFAVVYFDDIVVFYRSAKHRRDQVKHALTLPLVAKVTVEKIGLYFFRKIVNHQGHVIRSTRSQTTCLTSDGIKGLMATRNVTELRSFRGFRTVFRRLLPRLSKIASPLNDKLRKDQAFNLELKKKEREVNESFQKKFNSSPVLLVQYAAGKISLNIDACDVYDRFVLLQGNPKKSTKPAG